MAVKRVRESNIGIYVWRMPNGTIVGDGDGNILNIPSIYGDLSKISKITEVAKVLGLSEGSPVWTPQHRITDEEHEILFEAYQNDSYVVPEAGWKR